MPEEWNSEPFYQKKKKKRTVNLVPFHMLEGNLLFGENGRSAQFIQQS